MTIKYPSIEQFKNVIKRVACDYRYAGKDENGYHIYNNEPLPTLEFIATTKVHGCFEKNTLITLANGEKIPISQLQIGTYILSYDIKNNCEIAKRITEIFNRNDNNTSWCKLTFDDRDIICTKNHKFYTKNRGWVEAQHLTGDDVFIIE
jgi:hypothetical protein